MSCTIPQETFEQVIAFHGHLCPGVTIGVRAAEFALQKLGDVEPAQRVCITETDMCGVDAIQFLTCCTFGKGNLIHRDYGKMAFSFFRRDTGEGFRLLYKTTAQSADQEEMMALMGKKDRSPEEEQRMKDLRDQWQRTLMDLPLEELFECQSLPADPPRPARILQSLCCATCGEKVMESRTRRFGGQTLCIPCYREVEQKI